MAIKDPAASNGVFDPGGSLARGNKNAEGGKRGK